MHHTTVFDAFIRKLKAKEGEAEVKSFLTRLFGFSSAELFTTMLEVLTDEDLAAVEAIADERQAEAEVRRRFTLRTGMTPREFVEKLKEAVAQEYPQS